MPDSVQAADEKALKSTIQSHPLLIFVKIRMALTPADGGMVPIGKEPGLPLGVRYLTGKASGADLI